MVKPLANSGGAGGVGSIPGLGRCPGGGNGNPLPGKIPGTEEPGGLPSMGSYRVGPDSSNLAATAAVSVTERLSV